MLEKSYAQRVNNTSGICLEWNVKREGPGGKSLIGRWCFDRIMNIETAHENTVPKRNDKKKL